MSEILRSAAVALLAIVYLYAMHAFAFAQEVGAASNHAAHSPLDLLGWAALIFVVVVALAIVGVRAYRRVKRRSRRGGPHYFESWGINRAPIRLHGPLSEAEARAREEKGVVYYIGYFDDRGDPLTVEKRGDRKTYFTYNYLYEKGRVVEYVYTAGSESVCVRRMPTGSWVRIGA